MPFGRLKLACNGTRTGEFVVVCRKSLSAATDGSMQQAYQEQFTANLLLFLRAKAGIPLAITRFPNHSPVSFSS